MKYQFKITLVISCQKTSRYLTSFHTSKHLSEEPFSEIPRESSVCFVSDCHHVNYRHLSNLSFKFKKIVTFLLIVQHYARGIRDLFISWLLTLFTKSWENDRFLIHLHLLSESSLDLLHLHRDMRLKMEISCHIWAENSQSAVSNLDRGIGDYYSWCQLEFCSC